MTDDDERATVLDDIQDLYDRIWNEPIADCFSFTLLQGQAKDIFRVTYSPRMLIKCIECSLSEADKGPKGIFKNDRDAEARFALELYNKDMKEFIRELKTMRKEANDAVRLYRKGRW